MRSIFKKNEKLNKSTKSHLKSKDTKSQNVYLKAEPDTVFERVAIRQAQNAKTFKYKKPIFLAALVFTVALLFLLGSYLGRYNKNTPTTVCESIISALSDNDAEVFLKYCTNLPSSLKSEKAVKEYFKFYLPGDKPYYYAVASEDDRERKFIFKSGTVKIGEIIFRQSSENDIYGINKYYVMSFDLEPLAVYTVKAYSTYSVSINGKKADISDLYSQTEVTEKFSEFYNEPIKLNFYSVKGFNSISEISATDSDGTACEIRYNSKLREYTVAHSLGDVNAPIEKLCREFTENYIDYTLTPSASGEELLKYTHKASAVYAKLKSGGLKSGEKCSDIKTENLAVKNMQYYGNGFYCADVTADITAVSGSQIMGESFKKTLYIIKDGETFFIVGIE